MVTTVATPLNLPDHLGDVIHIKLKKPKSWNWQLSTSKSLPHISLPTIKLFDSKGRLLVEAQDSEGTQRRSWQSPDLRNFRPIDRAQTNCMNTALGDPLRLQRCRSDLLQRESTPSNPGNFPKNPREGLVRNRIENSKLKTPGEPREVSGRWPEKPKKYTLKKSRSDCLGNGEFPEGRRRNPVQRCDSVHHLESLKIRYPKRFQDLKSDDLYQRILKYNCMKGEQKGVPSIEMKERIPSMEIKKERIPSVEMRKERIPSIRMKEERIPSTKRERNWNKMCEDTEGKIQNGKNAEVQETNKGIKKPKRRLEELMTVEVVKDSPHKLNIETLTHKRYKTRTSSAGTLIIEEEDFGDLHPRRRRRNEWTNPVEDANPLRDGLEKISSDKSARSHHQASGKCRKKIRRRFSDVPVSSDEEAAPKSQGEYYPQQY